MSDVLRIPPKSLPSVASPKGGIKEEKDVKPGATVEKEAGSPAIVYTPSESDPVRGYEKNAHVYNKQKIEALKADAERSFQSLRDTVKAMLEKQGLVYEDVLKAVKEGKKVEVKVDEATQAQAQAAIAEDGHWGVKKTAERIIEFAKTISNDNPQLYDKLVASIKEGFEAAKSAFGGELPEISQKTYEAVMAGLDEWAGKTTTPPVQEPVQEPITEPVPEPS